MAEPRWDEWHDEESTIKLHVSLFCLDLHIFIFLVSSFLWMSKHTFRWAVIPLSLRTPPHPSIRSPIFSHIFISDGEPIGDKMVVGFILSPHLERRPKLLVTKMLDLSWISFHRFLCTYRLSYFHRILLVLCTAPFPTPLPPTPHFQSR